MAGLKFDKIFKEYENGFVAVSDFNLEVKDKEFIIFVGPSGCGKSTILRIIAGLEDISKGDLLIDNKKVNDVSPKNRDIAMVFQNYSLYPHMTVYENIAFGLKLRKMPLPEIRKKVTEVAKMLELESLLERRPKMLSGGQRQRVAMGRAIVREPKVFLMDEPLSNLDAKLRVQMRSMIAKLHKKLETTFIYVTHDQTEAMTLGTRIVVLKDGIIQQVDTPKALYYKPDNLFVASFIGSPQMNFIDSKLIKDEEENVFVEIGKNKIKLPEFKAKFVLESGYIDKNITFGIRPENLSLSNNELKNEKIDCSIDCTVDMMEMLGAETFLHLSADKNLLIARINPENDISIGDKLTIYIDVEKLHIFDKKTTKTIIH